MIVYKCLYHPIVPQLQSTVKALFTGAGTNHPTISSTEGKQKLKYL